MGALVEEEGVGFLRLYLGVQEFKRQLGGLLLKVLQIEGAQREPPQLRLQSRFDDTKHLGVIWFECRVLDG